MAKPVIGLTAALSGDSKTSFYRLNSDYADAVRRGEGIPLLLTPTDDREEQKRMLALVDGLLIPGGVDTAPCFYGEEPLPAVTRTDRRLDRFEIALVRMAAQMGKPVLGICRGLQLLNVACGGSLFQDIPTQVPGAIAHYQDTMKRSEPFHPVALARDSALAGLLGRDKLDVNTFHHQAVCRVGGGLVPVAHTSDGVIEGVESPDGRILGVQWHPEAMAGEDPVQQRLFDGFVALCGERKGPLSQKGEVYP